MRAPRPSDEMRKVIGDQRFDLGGHPGIGADDGRPAALELEPRVRISEGDEVPVRRPVRPGPLEAAEPVVSGGHERTVTLDPVLRWRPAPPHPTRGEGRAGGCRRRRIPSASGRLPVGVGWTEAPVSRSSIGCSLSNPTARTLSYSANDFRRRSTPGASNRLGPRARAGARTGASPARTRRSTAPRVPAPVRLEVGSEELTVGGDEVEMAGAQRARRSAAG